MAIHVPSFWDYLARGLSGGLEGYQAGHQQKLEKEDRVRAEEERKRRQKQEDFQTLWAQHEAGAEIPGFDEKASALLPAQQLNPVTALPWGGTLPAVQGQPTIHFPEADVHRRNRIRASVEDPTPIAELNPQRSVMPHAMPWADVSGVTTKGKLAQAALPDTQAMELGLPTKQMREETQRKKFEEDTKNFLAGIGPLSPGAIAIPGTPYGYNPDNPQAQAWLKQAAVTHSNDLDKIQKQMEATIKEIQAKPDKYQFLVGQTERGPVFVKGNTSTGAMESTDLGAYVKPPGAGAGGGNPAARIRAIGVLPSAEAAFKTYQTAIGDIRPEDTVAIDHALASISDAEIQQFSALLDDPTSMTAKFTHWLGSRNLSERARRIATATFEIIRDHNIALSGRGGGSAQAIIQDMKGALYLPAQVEAKLVGIRNMVMAGVGSGGGSGAGGNSAADLYRKYNLEPK